jgi:sulfite exporter TauE/SafE
MLSSIHPLGERTRNNRWLITVASFTIGSTAAGALVGAILGLLGSALPVNLSPDSTLIAMAVVAVTAGILDASGASVPGPERQVNEHWIGAFRGWVYGGAFGVQLGVGVMTFVVTWGVYAIFLLEVLSASPSMGALIGAVFGAGRSIGLYLAARVDRASRLTSFHSRMAALGPPIRLLAGFGAVAIGVFSVVGVLL